MSARALCLLPLLTLLAACEETRFAVDPLGEPRACESGLDGVWRIEDDGAREYVHLRPDCELRLLRPAMGGEGGVDFDAAARRTVQLSPAIGRIDGVLYLALTDDDFHRAADDASVDRRHAEGGGFHVFRIELRGEQASVRAVDHREVAKAIIDERLRGSVAKDERGLKNRLDLDLDASRALLPERWLFRRDDPLRLARVRPRDLPPAIRRQVAEAP